MTEKYREAARDWSTRQYADPVGYLRHRAALVVSLGPPLAPGATLLDLACGDGGLADFLPQLAYRGVDGSPAMVEEARRRGREVTLGDLNDYEPPEPVDATTLFRALYYATDRAAFFRRAAGYTRGKLIFDLNPRQYAVGDVVADLRAAGLERIELRPFFAPQTRALPAAAATLLRGLERSGPVARLLLRLRFTYLVAASRKR